MPSVLIFFKFLYFDVFFVFVFLLILFIVCFFGFFLKDFLFLNLFFDMFNALINYDILNYSAFYFQYNEFCVTQLLSIYI